MDRKGRVPIVSEPVARGFGSRMEMMLSRALDAKISRQWDLGCNPAVLGCVSSRRLF